MNSQLLRVILAAAPFVIPAGLHAADYKVGDDVEGKWGQFWTPGKVVAVDGSRYKVHYANYGQGFDSWLTSEQVRTPQAGASDTATAAINRFNANTAQRPAAGAPQAPAAATGYDNAAPVAPAPVAPAPVAPAPVAPAPVAPKAQAVAPAGAGYAVGDAVQVEWKGSWWSAKVLAVTGGHYRIHYDGYSDSFDEVVDDQRIRHVANAPAQAGGIAPAEQTAASAAQTTAGAVQPPAAGSGGLNGFYHQLALRFGYHGSTYYSDEYFWFRPDGFAYFGVPPGGLEAFADFSVLQKLDPKNCGSYSVSGGSITYQRGGDKPRTFKLKTEQNNTVLDFDGPSAIMVAKFPAGQKYDASYFSDAIAGDANTTVMSGSTINFHADGTFDGGRFGGIDTRGAEVLITGSETKPVHGTYSLSGNTLTFTADGKTVSLTAYPWPDKNESPPGHLGIGREMYRLTK